MSAQPQMEEITVEVEDSPGKVQFRGRWLVEPGGDGPDVFYGIAETGQGRIAVYSWGKVPAALADYDDLDDAEQEGGVPAEVIDQAAEALGVERVRQLDI